MCNTHTSHQSINKAAHSGFETQRRRHQKSKTGVSVAPQKGLLSSKNIFKNTYLLRLQILNKLRYENPEISLYVLLETCLSVSKIFSEIYFLSLIFYLISSNLPHRFHHPSNLTKVKAKSRHFKRTLFFSFFPRMLSHDYNEIKTYRKTVNDLNDFSTLLYCNVNECNVSVCVCVCESCASTRALINALIRNTTPVQSKICKRFIKAEENSQTVSC